MGSAGPHARLSARFGRPTWFFTETGSTNDEAVRIALDGAPHGALVLAERQTAGRGRLGRAWLGNPGEDLLFSLVLRPGTAPAETPLITLAAGVAVAETTGMRLKWPNDVVGRPAAAAHGDVRADGAGAAAQRRPGRPAAAAHGDVRADGAGAAAQRRLEHGDAAAPRRLEHRLEHGDDRAQRRLEHRLEHGDVPADGAGAAAQRRPESEPGWHKVAGLLAEMDVAEGRVRYVVLGVGLNVNQADFPPELPQAASLRMLGQGEQDRYALLERLLPALEWRVGQVRTARAEVLAAWAERAVFLGQPVQVGDLTGIAEGVRADGALLLRLASGRLVPVVAGDVLLADPPQELPAVE